MKRRKKRRKLYGAALKAHQKKVGRKRSYKKRSYKRRRRNKPWNKGRKLRKWKGVGSYSRKSSVKRHRRRVNPMARFRLPALPTARGMMVDVQRGVVAGAVLLGTFIGASWVGRQLERVVPGTQVGLPNLLLKMGTALGVVYLSRMAIRQPQLRQVAIGGAFFPLALEGIAMIAPGLAAQVPAIGAAALPAPAPAGGGMLSMPPGPRLSDYTMDAELEAGLETESESGMY